MNFAELCLHLDNVRSVKTPSEKTTKLREFWQLVRSNNVDNFSILRLLVPKLDRDRPSYRIKELKITKLIIKMLSLPPGRDHNLLLKSVSGSSTEFADVIHTILRKYIINKDARLTVAKLNDYLDKIAHRHTDHGLDDLILELFRKLPATNITWVVKMILKDLQLGLGENTILNTFHSDGREFYATNSDLRKLTQRLTGPDIKLNELGLELFTAFRPMLSKRVDGSNFTKAFPDPRTFIIETKFDGERFQLHIDEHNIKYFSRNAYDFTESFSALPIHLVLRQALSPTTKRVILDGEMMLYNTTTKEFGSKGMSFDVKHLGTKKYQPCFCAFDVLLVNDTIMSNRPLHKRLQVLGQILTPVRGVVELSNYKMQQTRQDIVDALNSSVDNDEEGIVVKVPESTYKFSERNAGWFKLKMDYFDDVFTDLDLLVMGGSLGPHNTMNSFIVGVKSGPNMYYTVGSVSSGLTFTQLEDLNERFRRSGHDFSMFSQRSLGQLFFGKQVPDVYIEPQDSCLFQIRASELVRSTSDHVKCPYTLRFPRVIKIREDKPVTECLTMNELLELTGQNKPVVKLSKRHLELNEVVAKGKTAKRLKLAVVSLCDVQEEFLAGKRFYVGSSALKWTVEDICHCIQKAGGHTTNRLHTDVDVVLTAKLNGTLIEAMKTQHSYDVVNISWLKRVLEAKRYLDYNQSEIYSIGCSYKSNFMGFDRYGDSVTEPATSDSVKYSVRLIEDNDEYLNCNGTYRGCFTGYVGYFDRFEVVNNPASSPIYYSFPDEIQFQYYGGIVADKLTTDVNIIIINGSEHREHVVQRFLSGIQHNAVVVDKQFVTEKKIK